MSIQLFFFPFSFDSYCCSTLSSMLVSPLLPSFLDWYSLLTSSLGCKALCFVINFLVLWSICLRSSPSISRMVPSILQGRQPSYLSLWWGSRYIIWFRVTFSLLLLFTPFRVFHTSVNRWFLITVICIHLLCDWSFRLYHYITYICCFIATYLFLLWYDWSLWRCFKLLLKAIHFPSWGFLF